MAAPVPAAIAALPAARDLEEAVRVDRVGTAGFRAGVEAVAAARELVVALELLETAVDLAVPAVGLAVPVAGRVVAFEGFTAPAAGLVVGAALVLAGVVGALGTATRLVAPAEAVDRAGDRTDVRDLARDEAVAPAGVLGRDAGVLGRVAPLAGALSVDAFGIGGRRERDGADPDPDAAD